MNNYSIKGFLVKKNPNNDFELFILSHSDWSNMIEKNKEVYLNKHAYAKIISSKEIEITSQSDIRGYDASTYINEENLELFLKLIEECFNLKITVEKNK